MFKNPVTGYGMKTWIFKYSQYVLTFEKLAALRYNLHTIKLNHLKHIVDGC